MVHVCIHTYICTYIHTVHTKQHSDPTVHACTFSVHDATPLFFVQVHSITDDGLKIKQLYNVDTFPYIALLDPRTGVSYVISHRVSRVSLLLVA